MFHQRLILVLAATAACSWSLGVAAVQILL